MLESIIHYYTSIVNVCNCFNCENSCVVWSIELLIFCYLVKFYLLGEFFSCAYILYVYTCTCMYVCMYLCVCVCVCRIMAKP